MKKILFPLFATAAIAVNSQAAMVLVDNFNSYTAGTLAGQGGWSNPVLNQGGSQVVADIGGNFATFSNSRINIATQPGNVSSLGLTTGTTIADNTTGTLFFQVNIPVTSLNVSFGLGDGAPSSTSDYNSQNAYFQFNAGTSSLGVRDGGSTAVADQVLATNTWYDLWLVANNTANTFTAYIQGGAFATQTQITSGSGATTTFDFRSAAGDLNTIISMGGDSAANTDFIRVDNIFIDNTGSNLTNPIPEPSVFALLAGGLASLVILRRRRQA